MTLPPWATYEREPGWRGTPMVGAFGAPLADPDEGRRNAERSPDDFMFQLTREEWTDLKCQIGT